jgi:V-type H+-transporting ATPase subunit E
LNNSRIEVLRARNDALEKLFEEASNQVKKLSSGKSYSDALENLILEVCSWTTSCHSSSSQVLLLLLAPEVKLEHRPKDANAVKKAAKKAEDRYKEMSGRETTIDFEATLNDDSAGGVIGSTMQGRIKVDNTLGERLKILEEKVGWNVSLQVEHVLTADAARAANRSLRQEREQEILHG